MPDRRPRPERTTPHKDKICKTCGRTFQWKKQWAQDWDVIKHCSDACRGLQPEAPGADPNAAPVADPHAALETAILSLLAERGPGKTICPSEAAKAVAGTDSRSKHKSARRDWEVLMAPARAAARRLASKDLIVVTQHGAVVDPATAKGPVRLRSRQKDDRQHTS